MMRYEPGEVESMNMNSLRSDIERIENKLKVEHRAALAAKDARIAELEAERTEWVEAYWKNHHQSGHIKRSNHRGDSYAHQPAEPATHSEDGGEVPEVVAHRPRPVLFSPDGELLMTVDQHERITKQLREEAATAKARQDHAEMVGDDLSRIVAAKDARVASLSDALVKIIEMNLDHAADQYGDSAKAESWSCVRVAREALAGQLRADIVGESGSMQGVIPAAELDILENSLGMPIERAPFSNQFALWLINSVRMLMDAQPARQVGGDDLQRKAAAFVKASRKSAELEYLCAAELEDEGDADESASCANIAEQHEKAACLVEELARAALAPVASQVGVDCGHSACESLGEPHPFCDFVKQMDARQVVRDREADRQRFSDPAFNQWLDEVLNDAGHTVWDQIPDVCCAWHGWENRQYYAQPARQVGGGEREAFEAHCKSKGWENRHLKRRADKPEAYDGWILQSLWLAWMARAALAPTAVCVIPEALRLVELLGLVAEKAFHLADGTQEDLTGETPVFTVDGDDFQALSDALDKCDEEPEIDDVYARDGWLTVLDKLRALLAQWKEVGA